MSATHAKIPTSFKQRLNWRGKQDMTVPQADPLAGLKTYQPGRGIPSAECPLVVSGLAWAEVSRDPHQNRSV
jgi:hypothetical protein